MSGRARNIWQYQQRPAVVTDGQRVLCAMWVALLSGVVSACNPAVFDQLPQPVEELALDDGASEGLRDAGDQADAAAQAPDASAKPPDGGDAEACPPQHAPEHVFGVKAVRELGVLPAPSGVTYRWVSGSALFGDRILWSFGGTFLPAAKASYPAAAWSTPAEPLMLEDVVGDDDDPLPIIERVAAEENEAIWLAGGSLIATSEGAGLWFFRQLTFLLAKKVGVVRVDAGEVLAKREAGYLFEEPDGLFYTGGFVDDGYVYLYDHQVPEGGGMATAAVARAPLSEATVGTRYRVWSADAQDWVAEHEARTPVLTNVPEVLSVSYNRYLGQYLAVFAQPLANELALHVASRPQGPFALLATLRRPDPDTGGATIVFGLEHPALRSACDRKLVLSYLQPTLAELTDFGWRTDAGKTWLLEVELE